MCWKVFVGPYNLNAWCSLARSNGQKEKSWRWGIALYLSRLPDDNRIIPNPKRSYRQSWFTSTLSGGYKVKSFRIFNVWTHYFQLKHVLGSRVVILHCLPKASRTQNLKINRHSFVAIFTLLDHLWIAICSSRTFATIIPSLITSVTYFQHAILSRHWVIIHVTKMSADILKGRVSSRSSYISVFEP